MIPAGYKTSAILLSILASAGLGAFAALAVYRRTNLSPRNWYAAAALLALLFVIALVVGAWAVVALGLGGLFLAAWGASVVGHRLRLGAGNATGELRDLERQRVMAWERGRVKRIRIDGQGEVVPEVDWPAKLPYVPLSVDESQGRVPRKRGRHILVLGGTGSGKTVSADRIALGRILADRVPALVLDPKGDERLAHDLKSAADFLGRPFVLFDPKDEQSDHWDPLWAADPGRTVARILSPLAAGDPYYSDMLRIHLGVVAEALRAVGLWPVSMPLLLEAAQTERFEEIQDLVAKHGVPIEIARRVEEQAAIVGSKTGERDIKSGAARLRVVAGTTWRRVLEPRGDGKAVQLPAALRAGAIILWRTWVDDLREEAQGITTLALADIIAAAAELKGERDWLVLLDEFGSVMEGNTARLALGVLGRARTAGGQAIVVTQSAADVPSATGNDAMLESLSDNFAAFVVHRQTSSQSRDWVAKLFGTRELWQATDRTGGGGAYADGTGSRRRIHEFLVRPDQLKELDVGKAFVWTPAGSAPHLVDVAMAPRLPEREPVASDCVYHDAGASSLREYRQPVATERSTNSGSASAEREASLADRDGLATTNEPREDDERL